MTLLLCHSSARDVRPACLSHVQVLHYDFARCSLNEVKERIIAVLSSASIRNLGLLLQTSRGRIAFTSELKAVMSMENLRAENAPLKRLLRGMVERLGEGAFVDVLLSTTAAEAPELASTIQRLTRKKISVRFVPRFASSDLPPYNLRIVTVYLDRRRLSMSSKEHDDSSRGETTGRQSAIASGYDRIRVVGKGASGAAILYRRTEDDSLVIVKEINMYELTTAERQLALNEVSLLAQLDHPNIVSYFDSSEIDGILMIEMEYADGGTLAQYLSRCTAFLPEGEVTNMLEQILSAVSYLHEHNVLHRQGLRGERGSVQGHQDCQHLPHKGARRQGE